MKKIFSSISVRGNSSITGAAFIIALLSIASRILGVVRDRILAGHFGAGQELDLYYAAFRLPDLIFNLLVLGALSAGFIPIFSKLLSEDQRATAWRLANNIFNIVTLLLIIVCGSGIIFAPWLVVYLTPGFPTTVTPTLVSLTRIMFLSPLLLGISSIVGGVLQSKRKFFIFSVSPIFYNLGIIAGAIVLTPYFGLKGLAWGVVIGSLFHLLIQLPTLWQVGFRYQLIADWRDRNTRAVFRMMSARTLSLAVTQINLIIITMIASTLPIGALSVFNLANNLQFVPISLFGISFALAVFPLLSATTDIEKLKKLFSRTFRQILFFIIPSTVIILALRAQIVRLILGSGKFSWSATLLTIDTLGFFAVSLFAQATLPLLNRVFFAQQDSRTPLYIGLVAEVVNISLALWLAPRFGVPGLALGFSISTVINFLLLLIVLRRRYGSLDERQIIISILKYVVAGIFAAVAIQAMKLLIWPYTDMSRFWGVLLQAGAAGLFGAIVYLSVCSLLRSEEFIEFWQTFKQRFSRQKFEFKSEDQSEARGM